MKNLLKLIAITFISTAAKAELPIHPFSAVKVEILNCNQIGQIKIIKENGQNCKAIKPDGAVLESTEFTVSSLFLELTDFVELKTGKAYTCGLNVAAEQLCGPNDDSGDQTGDTTSEEELEVIILP